MSKLWPGSGLSHRTVGEVRLPREVVEILGVDVVLGRVALLWMDPFHAIATTTLVISRPELELPCSVPAPEALSVDAVLRLVTAMSGPVAASALGAEVARLVDRLLELPPDSGVMVRHLADSVAIEPWDLTGSERSREGPFEGVSESREFAWELSALLSIGVDRVQEDGLWRLQRADQVFAQVREGFTFLNDHMALVSDNCCLETCHVVTEMRPRIRDRLERVGYDSSAIFVWSTVMLRQAILDRLLEDYARMAETLRDAKTMSADRYQAITVRVRDDAALVRRIAWFSDAFREPRNRSTDAVAAAARGIERRVDAVREQLTAADAAATDVVRLREQATKERTNILLAGAAAGLTAMGVPSVVEVMSNFIGGGRQWELAISVSALGLAFVVLLWLLAPAWRR